MTVLAVEDSSKPPVGWNSKASLTTQKRLMLALYTVKSTITMRVDLSIQRYSRSSCARNTIVTDI